MRRPESLLRDLLALIHRDAGCHTQEVGLEQSYLDAVYKVAQMRTEYEELKRTFAIIEKLEVKEHVARLAARRGPKLPVYKEGK